MITASSGTSFSPPSSTKSQSASAKKARQSSSMTQSEKTQSLVERLHTQLTGAAHKSIKPTPMWTTQDLVTWLETEARRAGSSGALARELGIHRQYLARALKFHTIEPALATKLGLKPLVLWQGISP